MLNKRTQPSTLGGIKRQAKQIKKSDGLPHHVALDIAAQNASFSNYAHAHHKLDSRTIIQSDHQLFFSVFWYDRKIRKVGREVLEISLSKPLLEIAIRNEFKKANFLGWFRLASPDHFVNDQISGSQEQAREAICKAVRVLRFMEATGLKPSVDHQAMYPNRHHNNRLPESDHNSSWHDPSSGQFILIDEPYLPPIVDGERASWAKAHNWHLQASKWPGMYYPGMSHLFVATDASTGYDFKGLVDKIDRIPAPITTENWSGTSTNGHDPFFSPLCVTQNDKKRALAKGAVYRTSSSKTLPMRFWGSPFNERRPNAAMSIGNHQIAAKLMLAIQQSTANTYAVDKRLQWIKSNLENWFFAEYDRSVTDSFDLFYYSSIDKEDPLVLKASSSKGVIQLLQELRSILLDAYVDCEPLRQMIRRVDTSIKLLSNPQ
ncbi:DUF5623 domain-containing protein [Pseudidiomarina sp. 1APP75-27a]|uniref:DUF5623 domain-containing protein n=1 Tax=Pseudidiomarina terrestris TaxID=2820060 RepID=UPI002B0547CD|nr:DUF5623 domain-containing protein [Pseudidiomarina sp. 1APP75-27a]MEA3588438.1 DUF5623 domain-containing protein [Pseudidiomarina sp. 1APP75-27a]